MKPKEFSCKLVSERFPPKILMIPAKPLADARGSVIHASERRTSDTPLVGHWQYHRDARVVADLDDELERGARRQRRRELDVDLAQAREAWGEA